MNKKVVVFDLDDTLYKEIDYLKSAYQMIASNISKTLTTNVLEHVIFDDMYNFYLSNENVFEKIILKYKISQYSINDLLELYRSHEPKVSLTENTLFVLNYFKKMHIDMHIITDGRSIQQRNKLKALRLEEFVDIIIISDEINSSKPNLKNFLMIEDIYSNLENITYYYIADNLTKDFIAPNKLNWIGICLKDNGQNIHSQNIDVNLFNRPDYYISNILECIEIIKKN